MATYVIGDYIREIRLRKGYTQEDVSFGICTSATLSIVVQLSRQKSKLFIMN